MKEEIWIEKYRPKKLDDVVGQEDVIKRLKSYVRSRNLPHLLLSGPPGVGKTATAICVARELFGESWQNNFTEMNASVSKDTPVLVRINGIIERTDFEKLGRIYFGDKTGNITTVNNLEVLSINDKLKIEWKKVSNIIRHKVEKILKVHFEGGKICLTGNHSIIIFDNNGKLVTKSAKDLNEDDYLISFITKLDCEDKKLALINNELAWFYGATAEGCLGSNDIIFVWNINEKEYINKTQKIAEKYRYGINKVPGRSGFDRNRLSSLQVIVMNANLANFMRNNFYGRFADVHTAHTKRIPIFMYNTDFKNRFFYLKGEYDGDGTGDWEGHFRITSVSTDLLKDIAWFGRISCIPTSVFPNDDIVHLYHNYNNPIDLIPYDMIVNLLDSIPNNNKYFGNWRYEFRHSLYHKKNGLVSKRTVKKLIDKGRMPKDQSTLDLFYGNMDNKFKENIDKINILINNDLHSTPIRKIETINYDDYVYDFSVPGNEMFFAGDIPILLHNSDERGIDVVRNKIKNFARTAPLGAAEFKIIFLDEADALTSDAQSALRRTMEKYTSSCRFILSCNYSSKIITPIQSRCAVYRFKPISSTAIEDRVKFIAKEEGLNLTEDGLDAIKYVASGDMRRAINAIQAAGLLDKLVNRDSIYQTTATAKPEDIANLIKFALEGDFIKARSKLDFLLIDQGLSGEDIIMQIFRILLDMPLQDKLKVNLIDRIGEADFRIAEGANDRIQLETLIANFISSK